MTGPLPAVANVMRADFIWSTSGDLDVMNRLFFLYTGGAPTAPDCVSFASSIFTAMAAQSSEWGEDVSLTNVIVTDLSIVSGNQGEQSSSAPGGKITDNQAASISLLANYHITRRYRGGKPRSYWPWLVGSDMLNRRSWSPAAVTAAEGALSTFFSTVIGTLHGSTTITEHVNVSYFSGFDVVTNPITGRARNVPKRRVTPEVDAITGFTMSLKPGSQRRRN